jgi:hypothetical protein
MDPITIAMLGGTALNALNEYSRNKRRKKMISPGQAKNDLTYSPSVLNQIRQQRISDVGTMNMANQQNIKQAGAMNRAPIGSIMDALAGSNYQAGKALNGLEPQLAQMKRQGALDYLDYQNRYVANENQQQDQWHNAIGGTIGLSTKMLALKSQGFFDDDESMTDGMYKFDFGSSTKPRITSVLPNRIA